MVPVIISPDLTVDPITPVFDSSIYNASVWKRYLDSSVAYRAKV